MRRDQETLTRIHMDALPLLHLDNLKSTHALHLDNLITADAVDHQGDKLPQECLHLFLILRRVLGNQLGELLCVQAIIHSPPIPLIVISGSCPA